MASQSVQQSVLKPSIKKPFNGGKNGGNLEEDQRGIPHTADCCYQAAVT